MITDLQLPRNAYDIRFDTQSLMWTENLSVVSLL